MPQLKIDLHVHTEVSPDAHTKRENLPSIIKQRGIDGVAITEHNRFQPSNLDALILPGLEVSSRDGHIVALGVQEVIPRGLPADETIQLIHAKNGIAIIAHPYDPVCECIKITRLKTRPDAVETINADALSFYFSKRFATRDAIAFKLPQVGGSDSHIPQTIGDAYTVVDANSASVADVIEAIRAGRVRAEGRATSIRNKLQKLSYKFR